MLERWMKSLALCVVRYPASMMTDLDGVLGRSGRRMEKTEVDMEGLRTEVGVVTRIVYIYFGGRFTSRIFRPPLGAPRP